MAPKLVIEIEPVAIEHVGSIIVTVGVVGTAGTLLTDSDNTGLVQPLLFMMVILYALPAAKELNTPVLFVDEKLPLSIL